MVNRDGDLQSWSDYYPFGLPMPTRSGNTANAHDMIKFTGYEAEDEGELGWYHAEARTYDPFIGRFTSVDPMAHLYPGHTPYHYVMNNPLSFTDPTGKYVVDSNGNKVEIETIQTEDGSYVNSYTFAEGTDQSVIDEFHSNAGIILDAMVLTDEGRTQTANLINAKNSIRLVLSSNNVIGENGGPRLGVAT